MAPTQDALYAGLDLELSWSERELPERERTKHVHRLHPYLGKFIPQLVEAVLGRYVRAGGTRARSVRRLGNDARAVARERPQRSRWRHRRVQLPAHAGQDRALQRVHAREGASRRLHPSRTDMSWGQSLYHRCVRNTSRNWFAPRAAAELLYWREIAADYEHVDVLRVVLARAARSARLTTHFDLDFPRTPQREPYWCHKHKRECRPVDRAEHFLRRYALDTLSRIKEFARVRARGRRSDGAARGRPRAGVGRRLRRRPDVAAVPGADRLPRAASLRVRAARLDDRRERELGAAASGTSRAALDAYVAGIGESLSRAADALRPGAPVLVVVNDRRDLYAEILERAGLRLEDRLRRHVNRRTGRRAGEYFEDVLVARR